MAIVHDQQIDLVSGVRVVAIPAVGSLTFKLSLRGADQCGTHGRSLSTCANSPHNVASGGLTVDGVEAEDQPGTTVHPPAGVGCEAHGEPQSGFEAVERCCADQTGSEERGRAISADVGGQLWGRLYRDRLGP